MEGAFFPVVTPTEALADLLCKMSSEEDSRTYKGVLVPQAKMQMWLRIFKLLLLVNIYTDTETESWSSLGTFSRFITEQKPCGDHTPATCRWCNGCVHLSTFIEHFWNIYTLKNLPARSATCAHRIAFIPTASLSRENFKSQSYLERHKREKIVSQKAELDYWNLFAVVFSVI